MRDLFSSILTQQFPTSNGNPLLWRPDLGIGYLKSNGMAYDEGYWENYQQNYRHSKIGEALNAFRILFVQHYLPPGAKLCDVGIGCGHFVETYPCKGFDVNERALVWLNERGLFADPYQEQFDALTFWDVLEHIDDPAPLLTVPFVFISLPIHQSVQACLASKHLKPNEHIWHFTEGGIKNFMAMHGYQLIGKSDGETVIGREDIMSYFFHK